MYRLLLDLRSFEATDSAFPFGESVHLATTTPIENSYVFEYLSQKGHDDISIEPATVTIEDCFMELMKKEL